MITVDVEEARATFKALLDRVEAGDDVTITRHGKPVARLVAAAPVERGRVDDAIARLKELRRGSRLGGDGGKMLRDSGRR